MNVRVNLQLSIPFMWLGSVKAFTTADSAMMGLFTCVMSFLRVSVFASVGQLLTLMNIRASLVLGMIGMASGFRLGANLLTHVRAARSLAPAAQSRSLAMAATASSVYDFGIKDAKGKDTTPKTLNKKVLLVVNVASQCGFTPQYQGLQELQDKYGAKGFSVVAFPCNQFGGQEPGTAAQVCDFASRNYKATFPIFDKVEVNGAFADPLWKYMKSSQGGFLTSDIKWNFSKFLVKDGVPIKRYGPTDTPQSIAADIDAALK